MKRYYLIPLILLALAVTLHAGYEHLQTTTNNPGRTVYAPKAGPATAWQRGSNPNEVYPAERVELFQETKKYLSTGNGTSTNTFWDSGLWEVDANGDYQPINNISASMRALRKDEGGITDVEWEVDTNGDLMPKL
jgi:hypothetical protein